MKKIAMTLPLVCILFGCASFGYVYYGIDWEERTADVVLFDPENDKPDISFTECKPDRAEKGKCVVLKREEFFKIRRDMEAMRIRIKELEKNCQQPQP